MKMDQEAWELLAELVAEFYCEYWVKRAKFLMTEIRDEGFNFGDELVHLRVLMQENGSVNMIVMNERGTFTVNASTEHVSLVERENVTATDMRWAIRYLLDCLPGLDQVMIIERNRSRD